jgi:hypothetical protein
VSAGAIKPPQIAPPRMTVHQQATNERSSLYLVVKFRESDALPRGIAPRVVSPVVIVLSLGYFSDRLLGLAPISLPRARQPSETSHRVW